VIITNIGPLISEYPMLKYDQRGGGGDRRGRKYVFIYASTHGTTKTI
jgi:hypothetical protein